MTAARPATALLDPGLALRVERLVKRYPTRQHFEPAQPFFARRERLVAVAAAEAVDEDDEFEDDEVIDVSGGPEAGREAALVDVSFELSRGRALAVVGSAGAGKTTLLRVLGGVTSPTAGRVLVRGRVAPTIEFGTTVLRADTPPRKNARMIAALIGVPRAARGRYCQTLLELACPSGGFPRANDPKTVVKRLAVAAALDPSADVLLLDGLPAMKDPAFRASCLERLEDAGARGATVLLGTDDLVLARRLCTDALWLERGTVMSLGPANEVLDAFASAAGATEGDGPPRGFSDLGAIGGVRVGRDDGGDVISFELETGRSEVAADVSVHLVSGSDDVVLRPPARLVLAQPGLRVVRLQIPPGALPSGRFAGSIRAALFGGASGARVERADAFLLERAPGVRPSRDSAQPTWSVD